MTHLALAALALAACHGDPHRARVGPLDGPARGGSLADNQAHPAAEGPVGLALATRGTELALTFTNVSPAALKVATRVESDRVDFDWLEVRLTDAAGASRVLHFVSDRDESARIVADLAPGASHVERLDLAEWAIRPGNDAELAPGTYQVDATWDAARETDVAAFTATATGTMTVAAPVEERCAVNGYRAPAGAKVQLLAHQLAGGGATVDVGLHNAGTEPVCVWARIQTHEVQSDWLRFQLQGPHYTRQPDELTVRLDDDRDKSYPVSVRLDPGATAWASWDVTAWAKRSRNGGVTLAPDRYWVTAVYDTTKEDEVWAGQVQATMVLVVP